MGSGSTSTKTGAISVETGKLRASAIPTRPLPFLPPILYRCLIAALPRMQQSIDGAGGQAFATK